MSQSPCALSGIKVAMYQMEVVQARPDINTRDIIQEIANARKEGVDIFITPEAAVPGYMIGDKWEDESFITDCIRHNKAIINATKGSDMVVIWGSVFAPEGKNGEDGRSQKWNAAFTAQNGKLLNNGKFPVTAKMLMADYRFFDDNRHFHSLRKIAEEQAEITLQDGTRRFEYIAPSDALTPIEVSIRGVILMLGVMLCEDMWSDDYVIAPGKVLVESGAQILINLSCSPWGWQKNKKRHRVAKSLLEQCKVPMIYVNNTGAMDNGANIISFDGSSCIYNNRGEVIFEIPPYCAGVRSITLEDDSNAKEMLNREVSEKKPSKAEQEEQRKIEETIQLYAALKNSFVHMINKLPQNMRKVVVGLSGGIDSATVLALAVDVIGAENCIAVNMPSQYNSKETKDIAHGIAKNLGVEYLTRPIGDIVDAIAVQSGAKPGTLAYENIQATSRMEILKAIASKRGAVFTANGNKVEAAFGYCTLYGDTGGFLAPIADLVKREVRQIAHYMNQRIYCKEVIPRACIDMLPTAELNTAQRDPFDYGSLTQRGYHDEMVRAFVEFRLSPEWFINQYISGTLEESLKLPTGRLKKLFPSAKDFVKDLEHKWNLFHNSFHKRKQFPPIVVVSKRAFGYDLREAFIEAYFTLRYEDMKQALFARVDQQLQSKTGHQAQARKVKERVIIYGGSFNPPALNHSAIIEGLAPKVDFSRLIILPCGSRPDKPGVDSIDSKHRREIIALAFQGIRGVEIDFTDLENESFTPNVDLEVRYQEFFPTSEIWFVIGPDIIKGGASGQSQIHTTWRKGAWVWQNQKFIVVHSSLDQIDHSDLPPRAEVIEIQSLSGRSTHVRKCIQEGQPFEHMVDPSVAQYIHQHQLYK